ncbi:DUF4192 domain-containing protein [Micromonospora sp. CPCC 205371]|nr:DUF4192 domain-containing protein [Micromonospora sp. CPCC 205371]
MPRRSAALISSAVGCGAPGTETRARADTPGSPARWAGSTYSGSCPAAPAAGTGAPEVETGGAEVETGGAEVETGGADVCAGGPDAGGAETAADAEARPATDDEVAWLTVLLVHLPVRDYAWEHTGHEDWYVDLWADVVRRAEEEVVAGPASLLAYAAWRSGQGALAHAGVDRALAADPAYSMALLMRDVLQRAIPPSTLDEYPVPEQARAGARRAKGRRRARA